MYEFSGVVHQRRSLCREESPGDPSAREENPTSETNEPTHVLGLEISVHDVPFVQVLDSVDQGIHDFARFGFREPVGIV